MDVSLYEFKQSPGLPPDGEPYPYFGFDETGDAYLLCWHDGGWVGLGYDVIETAKRGRPVSVIFRCGDVAPRIVSHAAAPLPWRMT